MIEVIDNRHVDPQLIETLQELLAYAKSGELKAFTFVGVAQNQHTMAGLFGMDDERTRTQAIGKTFALLQVLSDPIADKFSPPPDE